MNYPTLEQYNEALQSPSNSLKDPVLKGGTVATTGLGLPLALCGGFALTYTIKCPSRKYAVRCFHKQSTALETRYKAISTRIKNLRSPYFVDFEFQPEGVLIAGKLYPVVKMAWAQGVTLGEFLEKNYRNTSALQNLRISLRNLSTFLHEQQMAHGDIQPGNVMVSDEGKKVQLIDYDGIYVAELRNHNSGELGHRNFQHPKRSSHSWGNSLDRFSFISLDFSIRVLSSHNDLWAKTSSDADSVLFKANDFADPGQSHIFKTLIGHNTFSHEAKNFAAICSSSFDETPTLEDYLSGRNIPQLKISITTCTSAVPNIYLSAFPVLDATKYELCLTHVGDKVELIGQIIEVKQDKTKFNKPYVFINFGPWKGSIVKISIWSEGLDTLSNKPSSDWIGKWVSVVGLMEPPYISRQYHYSHLAISITQSSQLHIISEQEARFRLSGSSTRYSSPNVKSSNDDILQKIGRPSQEKVSAGASSRPKPILSTPPPSANQTLLQKMHGSSPATYTPTGSRPVSSTHNSPSTQPSTSKKNCFIATAVYGAEASETNLLRIWRDEYLLSCLSGRIFVSVYYKCSPLLAVLLLRNKNLNNVARSLLDMFIKNVLRK